jgi:hypothetical protein
VRSDAAAAIVRRRHFPVKSAETVTFAASLRLTGELPDVGTDGVFHRNLIRDDDAAHPDAGLPSRRRHCRISPMFGPTLPRQSGQGNLAKRILAKGILEG